MEEKSSQSGQSTDNLYVNQWMFRYKLQFLKSLMKATKNRDTLSIGNDSFQINTSFSSDDESYDIVKKPPPETKAPIRKKKR